MKRISKPVWITILILAIAILLGGVVFLFSYFNREEGITRAELTPTADPATQAPTAAADVTTAAPTQAPTEAPTVNTFGYLMADTSIPISTPGSIFRVPTSIIRSPKAQTVTTAFI